MALWASYAAVSSQTAQHNNMWIKGVCFNYLLYLLLLLLLFLTQTLRLGSVFHNQLTTIMQTLQYAVMVTVNLMYLSSTDQTTLGQCQTHQRLRDTLTLHAGFHSLATNYVYLTLKSRESYCIWLLYIRLWKMGTGQAFLLYQAAKQLQQDVFELVSRHRSFWMWLSHLHMMRYWCKKILKLPVVNRLLCMSACGLNILWCLYG